MPTRLVDIPSSDYLKTPWATAAEQRQLWRDVGEALLEGRVMHPANQAFGSWCANEGFDMDRRVRADSMWLAENWLSLSNHWTTGDSHPTAIRSAFKSEVAPPAPDLDLSEATTTLNPVDVLGSTPCPEPL